MTTPSGRKAADFFFRGLYTSGLFHISPAQPARCPPAENPANNEKLVPRSWMNKEGNYVTDEFINYVEPLILGDYQPFMVNGLPQHLVLKKK